MMLMCQLHVHSHDMDKTHAKFQKGRMYDKTNKVIYAPSK